MGGVTTSNLPGTTLGVIEVDLGQGKTLYDTPGLIIQESFTRHCSTDELKLVVPRKRVEPTTYRVEPGGSLLVGGMCRIDLHPESR